MHKKLKLDYTIFNDLYLFLSKVIGKKEIRIYINTLNNLFRVNSRDNIIKILMNLKSALEEDEKLYTSDGEKLEKLILSATNKSLSDIKSVARVKDIISKVISNSIKVDLKNISFKVDKYKEYKSEYSEIDYQRIIVILDIVIKETNQNKFKGNILKAIKKMTELSNLDLTELQIMKNRLEIWISCYCKINNGENPGGWAYILDVAKVEGSNFTLSGAFSMTTKNYMGLYVVKESIIKANELGFTHIVIYTKSEYVFNLCMNWMIYWKSKGWLTKENKPPVHLELVKELYELFTKVGNNITLELIDPEWKIPLYNKVVSLAKKKLEKNKGD
jgi:ribonuclease HI